MRAELQGTEIVSNLVIINEYVNETRYWVTFPFLVEEYFQVLESIFIGKRLKLLNESTFNSCLETSVREGILKRMTYKTKPVLFPPAAR